MIIKGRTPTIRHVSRTHRVALDWLFDRISLDAKIQIKYIETKNQLADILTKGNFTRDEWNHFVVGFDRVCFDCIGKPEIWKSERTSDFVCAANKHGGTRIGCIKLFRREHQRQVVFTIVEIWWNIHGKELLRQFTLDREYKEGLTSKQMFDTSEKLIVEQSDGIYGVTVIDWEDSSRKQLSLVNNASTHNLIQKIENHFQRQALQSDLQQHRAFNPFSKESQDAIKAAGNNELCEIADVEPQAQCKACLTYWDVGIVCCTCGHFLRDDTTENKKYIKSILLYPEFLEKPATRSQVREERRLYRISHCEWIPKEVWETTILAYSRRFIRDTCMVPKDHDRIRSHWSVPEMGKFANEDHTHRRRTQRIP